MSGMETSTLKAINVEIPLQQITAIIGPSGCGKSTLLKSLNRLVELNEQARAEGQVLLDKANIYDKTADATEVRIAHRPAGAEAVPTADVDLRQRRLRPAHSRAHPR